LLEGKRIERVEIHRASVVKNSPDQFIQATQGQLIRLIERRAKYILIHLERGGILGHLGMSGKFILDFKLKPIHSHDRVIFTLEDQSRLIFSEIRCFGFLEYLEDLATSERLERLGPDGLIDEIDPLAMRRRARGSRRNIKEWIMDQAVIAGIGNIYANEILFAAQVKPTRQAGRISKAEWERILKETKGILELALIHNGTSISDYRRVDDKTGEFQGFLQVYGKEGQPCPRCGRPIKKITQGGRSSWYCC